MKRSVHSILYVFLTLGLLSGLLICQLTACSLAAEDGTSENGGDRLVGMFLTTEYVNTVDWNSVDVSALMDGGTISGSEEKIYGTFDQEQGEYIFEGLEGYSLGVMKMKSDDGENYLATAASDCFTDVKLNLEDRENICSGVLYFDQTQISSQELRLYGNAVYETRDGTVYLVPGSGVQLSGAGGDCSVTLSDTVTEVDNGKKTETKNTFQATYRGVCPIQAVKFTWQDKDGKVLKEESFAADEIPSSIIWEKETACILVTLQKTDKTAEYDLIREEDETYMLYTEKEPGNSLILGSKAVEVKR